MLLRKITILIAVFFATNPCASAQSIPSGPITGASQSALSGQAHESNDPSSPSPLRPVVQQTLEAPGQQITFRQNINWFIASKFGPQHLAGEIFLSDFGTALDRPKEYESHWKGFDDRYGILKTSTIIGNDIEVGAGVILREDPRYFRAPDRAIKVRVRNVLWLRITARGGHSTLGPAYGRYMAIAGINFLSDTWRVYSKANARDALLRTSEGFAGRMAANAFEEFWPDVKKRVFHLRN